MNSVTIYEFDALVASGMKTTGVDGLHGVPTNVFAWLEGQCLRCSEGEDAAWLRMIQRRGHRAIQVKSHVGVVRAPDGFQIEVLPKVGKVIGGGVVEARKLLLEMLRCLPGFRHIQTDSAQLSATKMPLLEVFIAEFLRVVDLVVKRGLRGDYTSQQGNLFSLRGKLLTTLHLRHNICRADRFFTDHDEFTSNRPENRLLHAAIRRVMAISTSQENQRFARELDFVFFDIPVSELPVDDFQQVRFDRGMGHYIDALAWVRLILDEESPLTGDGHHRAPSLLFPMEAVFEAFVAKHLTLQLSPNYTMKTQARSHHLVRHREQNWFRLKPDLLVKSEGRSVLVLDSKWKLLDSLKSNSTAKYGLAQSDFYQLQAYGQTYLDGAGDIVLIFPKTDSFGKPLPVFEFPKSRELRLWVLPFCLKTRKLLVSSETPFASMLR